MQPDPRGWPCVRTFTGRQLTSISMPVGGVGSGCLGFGGRGQLTDWQIAGRPANGYAPPAFLAVSVGDGERRTARVLEGRLTDAEYAGADGSRVPAAGLPRFADAEFDAAYPFGRVRLNDPAFPVTAVVGAFNPLIAGDADASGLPVAVIRAAITNPTDRMLDVTVCATAPNIAGRRPGAADLPDNPPFRVVRDDGVTTLLGSTTAVPDDDETFGTVALGTTDPVDSLLTNWTSCQGRIDLLDVWDDLTTDGRLVQREGTTAPVGTLAGRRAIGPGETAVYSFLIAWHFPHRRGWGTSDAADHEPIVGNHYATRFADAAAVIDHVAGVLPDLERRTTDFVDGVIDCGAPVPVIDAALSNLAVLRSPTVLRAADGRLYGWEGVWDAAGSCFGNCTHVWNYQYAVESLFGDLAWGMRETEFVDATDADGLMSFRIALPAAERGTSWRNASPDGQMGTIVRLYRVWRSTGDDTRLRALWPRVRRALEFAWIAGGWDADADGLMEGCQHTTMDVEYYGPSGYVQSWYLTALAAAAEMAVACGDSAFADRCRALLEQGCRLTDEQLFNGEYYQQQLRVPADGGTIAPGLRHHTVAAADVDPADPPFQVGPGCQADQLAGYWMGRLAGLRVPLNVEHVRAATDAVLRHNFRSTFDDHACVKRTYAGADEAGTLNATYPRGGRPRRPFPYWSETWTGIEYTAAIGLACGGRTDDALRLVTAVRDRYDGVRRNPFAEVECGRHYVRSMASWGLLEAWQAGSYPS